MLICCGLFIPFYGQDQDEVIAEKVKVVNVEVPVRVFAAGKPVVDLKKEDFTILEDGRPQAINGFYINSKKIIPSAEVVSEVQPVVPSRYFVLVFRVHDFNDSLRKGLAYVFDRILRPEDRMLAFVNDFAREYPNLAEMGKVRLDIEQNMRDQCHVFHDQMLMKLREIDELVKIMKYEERGGENPAFKVLDSLQKYLELMRDYKRRFLIQSLDKYYLFSKYLEKISGEKWVISFCQKEMLPRLSGKSEAQRQVDDAISICQMSNRPEDAALAIRLSQLLRDLEHETSSGVDFPIEEVSKLFYKVNTTFHSLLINTRFETDSPDLEFKPISGGMEQSLRELSEKTGGTAISSTDLESSLAAIVEKEDSYYMLTYAPQSSKVGKIRVSVARKECKVIYDDNQRADYINEYLKKMAGAQSNVKIEGLTLTDRRLSLTISGYSLAKLKDGIAGFIGVQIRVKNAQNQNVYNVGKIYKAGSPSFGLSLDLSSLERGRYNVVVDVIDKVGGKTTTDFIQPLVQ